MLKGILDARDKEQDVFGVEDVVRDEGGWMESY